MRKKRSSPKREREGRSPPKVTKREKPSEQLPELDPYLDAADLELEKARKKFEKAQKAQMEAHEKKQKMVKKQNEEVALAQEETKKFFEEQKRKYADEVKAQKAGFAKKKQHPNNQQHNEETQGLFKAFKSYLFRVEEE